MFLFVVVATEPSWGCGWGETGGGDEWTGPQGQGQETHGLPILQGLRQGKVHLSLHHYYKEHLLKPSE